MEERKISMAELLVYLLQHWRVVILLALVGGLIMGGLSIPKYQQSQLEQQKAMQIDVEAQLAMLEEQLAMLPVSRIDFCLYQEKLLADYMDLLTESMDRPMEERTKLWEMITALQDSIAAIKGQMTEPEKTYYNYLSTGTLNVAVDKVAVFGAKDVLKRVLLGVVVPVFMYLAVLFFSYVLDPRIRYTDSIQDSFGILEIGVISSQKRKRLLAGFDNAIQKLSERDNLLKPEDSIKLAAEVIKEEAGRFNLASVSLISCVSSQEAIQVCNHIGEILGKENISVNIFNNVLHDVESRKAILNVKAVALVEKAGESPYKEISEEVAWLTRQGIQILGGILVE